MARSVALIGVLVVFVIGVGGISAQYEQSVETSNNQTTVVNETFQPTVGINSLNNSNRDVVYGEDPELFQNGSEIPRDENWTWIEGNGTVDIPSGTQINLTRSAKITYNYTVPRGAQRVSRDVALLPYEFGNIGVIVGGALVLTAIAVLGRQR